MSGSLPNSAKRNISPRVDSTNHQNIGTNSYRNHPKDNKTLDSSDDTEIENMVEVIEPPLPPMLKSVPRQNIYHNKRLKLETGDEYEAIDVPCYSVQDMAHDDCETFGRYVTTQLRQMSKMQKFLAQRLISEVCFRGQIQSLHMTTVLNTQTTVFQQQQTVPVFTVRPAQFSNKGSDVFIPMQHSVRNQANGSTASQLQQFQSYINLHQGDQVNHGGTGQTEILS